MWKTLLLVSTVFAMTVVAADKKVVAPAGAKPGMPFSPAILSGGTLYVSGQIGMKDGKIPEKFEDEVQAALDAISTTLKAGGYTLADAVTVQVYLTDLDLFPQLNKVYMANFPEPRPARTTVGVAKLVAGAHIEITVTARK